jgi:hypothetical protein
MGIKLVPVGYVVGDLSRSHHPQLDAHGVAQKSSFVFYAAANQRRTMGRAVSRIR